MQDTISNGHSRRSEEVLRRTLSDEVKKAIFDTEPYPIDQNDQFDPLNLEGRSTEIESVVEWVKRVHYVADDIPVVKVLSIPEKTHYVDQKAVVTIYDPVMKELEKYIPDK